ncbi:AAA family ATPase [Sphingomonas sp.]|uniref:AAA family ATPase n=1 Tax=Sphingomonas sp. TaxID=28214 RepID=UPI003BAC1885
MPTAQEVFPIVGKPTVTYVAQESGNVEKRLRDATQSRGQLCLLTGPSKLGKTTLYKRVLSELKRQPVVIRCTEGLDARNFWASALEDLNFEQIQERSKGSAGEVSFELSASGEFGWGWLAKIIPSVKLAGTEKSEESFRYAVIKSDISAKHLIPVLRTLPVLLVVEDFHYLSDAVKREIFQQWKAFVDEEVSVLVVSTTHHASDIARSNPDLRGRTRHIELDKWNLSDLSLIPKRGFEVLGVKSSVPFRNMIANESCGLPIVAQQICQTFALGLDLSPSSLDRRRDYQPAHLHAAFVKVMELFYSDYERDYERLLAGPRSGSRKYDTYGAILGAFALEPLEFSLRKHELVGRVQELSEDEKIPLASINSSLTALAGHQRRMGVNLLEWQAAQDMLHITEPTFLFFLRQKLKIVGSGNKGFSLNQIVREFLQHIKVDVALPRVRVLESDAEPTLPFDKPDTSEQT